tara:strand:- start:1542 stop:2024 length:483 start_codon:yes stop_codon:yes gene_type:complete
MVNINKSKNKFMMRAIKLSIKNVKTGGGPFGTVIVKNNKIIAEGYNKVTKLNDPTAHGEIVAIRNACKSLKTFNLEGTQLYTSCEPCPMCLSAIYWAHIEKIYFGNTRSDAAEIGFDDEFIYKEFTKNQKLRKIQMNQILKKEAKIAFNLWKENPDKIEY